MALGHPVSTRNRELYRKIGVVLQETALYDELTPFENLQFAASLYGLANPQTRIEEVLNLLDLTERARQRTGQLSGDLNVASSLCAAGLGAALGTVLRGSRNVAMAGSILATYLFLMGGGLTTIAFLPRWLRVISAFDPMRYAIDGLREALFYPDLTGFATDLVALTGTAIGAVLTGSVLVLRSWRN